MQRTTFITGGNGAIGQALCKEFKGAGWRVISSDQDDIALVDVDVYIPIELRRFCNDDDYQKKTTTRLVSELNNNKLHALVNNAAVQVIAPVEGLTVEDWSATLGVNLVAPFLLIQVLLPQLKNANGSVTNIASIHAKLTKAHFTAYATSKAALVGMTRSLAVELGSHIRVNAICPAAISTSMLEAGFDSTPDGIIQLASFHPSGCIGTTKDVAEAALYLAEVEGKFLNGAVLGLDGGVASRLHDPF